MSHPMTGSTGDNSITAPLKTRTVDFTGKMVRWICILLFLFAAIPAVLRHLSCHPAPWNAFRPNDPRELVDSAQTGMPFLFPVESPFPSFRLWKASCTVPRWRSFPLSLPAGSPVFSGAAAFSRLTPSSPAFGQDILPLQRKTAAESGFLAFCRLPRLYSPLCYSPC